MTFVNVSCFKGRYLNFSFLQKVTSPGGHVFDRSYSLIAFRYFVEGELVLVFIQILTIISKKMF